MIKTSLHSVFFFFCILSILVLTSCTTTQTHASTQQKQTASEVQESDMKTVENFQFLGAVEGTSGWGNLVASAGIKSAKKEAKKKAAAMGATHIVFTSIVGGGNPYVSGNAYRSK